MLNTYLKLLFIIYKKNNFGGKLLNSYMNSLYMLHMF